jgi:hypothetical protein
LFSKDKTIILHVPSHFKTFEIPPGVTIIDDGAFADCTNLTEIVIPESVEEVKSGAFGYCSNLSKIHLKKKNPPVYLNELVDLEMSLSQLLMPVVNFNPEVNWPKITLYVPKDSGHAYRYHYLYLHFKEVIKEL